ncbi:hypothetical protein MKW94_002279 [Papaver nudicaule]|uniref:Uncharacterized protein n=1 Tax=Papaver nudicaule TaxID=74823 RepID=A0AA42AY24_PAPNU|nr:hypothetical protein [Papaver nudicaule]
MQGDSDMKDTGIAVTDIGAATYLASLSIGLSSLIGAWVGSSSNNIFMSEAISGLLDFEHSTSLPPCCSGFLAPFPSTVFMVILLHFLGTNSTPLHQYQPPNRSLVKRVDRQIRVEARTQHWEAC